jgi:hypothetical protein
MKFEKKKKKEVNSKEMKKIARRRGGWHVQKNTPHFAMYHAMSI